LRRAELAAMELGDFPVAGQRTWIGMGQEDAWHDLKREYPDANFAGQYHDGRASEQPRVELPPGDWQAFRARSVAGSEPQPNVVHFPPDKRYLSAPRFGGARLIDTTSLNWSAPYAANFDVDSLLLTLRALRPANYDETVRHVNVALGRRKRVVGFGGDGRLAIEGETGDGAIYRHPPEHLSSGEQQILLLIAYVGGFLRPGGILLIDEAELHIQFGMVHLSLSVLEQIVRQRDGQLIIV